VVFVLCEEINIIFSQEDEIGAAIAVQVTGAQRIGGELAVLDLPSFGGAPSVGALVVQDDQFLGLSIIGDIRPAITVQVRNYQRRNAFLGGYGFDAEAGVREPER